MTYYLKYVRKNYKNLMIKYLYFHYFCSNQTNKKIYSQYYYHEVLEAVESKNTHYTQVNM